MSTSSEQVDSKLIKVVVAGVISFVGICFLSVSIWLATTVSSLAKSSATLELTILNLTKQTEKLGDKVDEIAKEQQRRTINVYRVTALENELTTIKKRLAELEKK